MDELKLENLERVLNEYCKDAVEIYNYQIALGDEHGNKNASRNLTDTLQARIEARADGYSVIFNIAEYYKYIEGGSKGTQSSPEGAVYPAHFPPPKIIEQWINVKPILPRPDDHGHLPSPQELSWAIATTIERNGIKPFPALATTKEELKKIYEEKIQEALMEDMKTFIKTF